MATRERLDEYAAVVSDAAKWGARFVATPRAFVSEFESTVVFPRFFVFAFFSVLLAWLLPSVGVERYEGDASEVIFKIAPIVLLLLVELGVRLTVIHGTLKLLGGVGKLGHSAALIGTAMLTYLVLFCAFLALGNVVKSDSLPFVGHLLAALISLVPTILALQELHRVRLRTVLAPLAILWGIGVLSHGWLVQSDEAYAKGVDFLVSGPTRHESREIFWCMTDNLSVVNRDMEPETLTCVVDLMEEADRRLGKDGCQLFRLRMDVAPKVRIPRHGDQPFHGIVIAYSTPS